MIKTVSLEIAKALKDAGFRQDTAFHWYGGGAYRTELCYGMLKVGGIAMEILDKDMFNYAAPTTDELLDELPKEVNRESMCYHLRIAFGNDYGNNVFYLGYEEDEEYYLDCPLTENKSLSEALAQMYLWLKKEGLIK